MMTMEVAHEGMASVNQRRTAMTKMAMTRCWTTVSPSIPKQVMGKFQTINVMSAVTANISALRLLKSPESTL